MTASSKKSTRPNLEKEIEKAHTVLSLGEVANLLGVNRATIFRLIQKKRIVAFRVGWVWRVAREDLMRYVTEQSNQ